MKAKPRTGHPCQLLAVEERKNFKHKKRKEERRKENEKKNNKEGEKLPLAEEEEKLLFSTCVRVSASPPILRPAAGLMLRYGSFTLPWTVSEKRMHMEHLVMGDIRRYVMLTVSGSCTRVYVWFLTSTEIDLCVLSNRIMCKVSWTSYYP